MAVSKKKRLNLMEMRCLKSMCRVKCMNQVRNKEVQRRTGVMRVGWLSRAGCVEVVWTHGENGGVVGDENSKI